jgi:hypothetical protein
MNINLKINLKSFALGASLTLGLFGVYGLAVAIPNIFAPGDLITAEKMNANFTALKTATNALEAKTTTLETAKVTGLKLTSAVDDICTVIDNPLTNGNPNLILSVSASRVGLGIGVAVGPVYIDGKWNVCTITNGFQSAVMNYYIMVIKP